MSDPSITDFMVGNTLAAFGTLARILHEHGLANLDSTDWEALQLFPLTLNALRQMPENFQSDVATPYLSAVIGGIVDPEAPCVWKIAEFDAVLAGGTADLLEMTMQMMQQQAQQRAHAQQALAQGKGGLLAR